MKRTDSVIVKELEFQLARAFAHARGLVKISQTEVYLGDAPTKVIDRVLESFQSWSEEHGVRVNIQVVCPYEDAVLKYSIVGAIVGAGIGAVVAGPPGCITGVVIGGALGGAAAHINVRILINENGSGTLVFA